MEILSRLIFVICLVTAHAGALAADSPPVLKAIRATNQIDLSWI